VTSDLRHHTASESLEAGGPALVDAAHYATEWPWLPVAAELLEDDLCGRIQVGVSERSTDPWNRHVGDDGVPAEQSAG
jgi:putative NIF3 family GTP cyclohydrolase 1 type 2